MKVSVSLRWVLDLIPVVWQVYLPAIEGHVPNQMLCAIRSFLEFCYIVRHSVITEKTLIHLEDALARFHEYRTIFQEEGIRPTGFSLPRQHSMYHYPDMIRLFGAPNGLCSSITEAKHIKAVKEPWRRSNRNKPLKQMLLTNQRLDKLAAARINFTERGMLEKSKLGASLKLIGPSFVFSEHGRNFENCTQSTYKRPSTKKERENTSKTLSTSSATQR